MAETVIHMLRGGTDNRRAFYCVFWGLVQRRGECAPVIESVFMRCALKARNRARIKPCNRRILCYIPRRFCRSSYAKQRKQNNRPMCWEWNKREPFGICIHGPLCKMTSLFPPAKLFAPFLRQALLLELFFSLCLFSLLKSCLESLSCWKQSKGRPVQAAPKAYVSVRLQNGSREYKKADLKRKSLHSNQTPADILP